MRLTTSPFWLRFARWLVLPAALAALFGPLRAHATFQTKYGPFDVDLDLGVKFEVEWTDNINSSEDDPESELSLIAGPYIGGTVGLDLPIAFAGGQKLSVSTSFSYEAEYRVDEGKWHETLGSPISVNAVLPFIIYGWDLNLYDTFTFTDEPLETSFGFNEDQTEEYDNTAGVTLGKRYGRYGITFNASRMDIWAPDAPTIEETSYTVSVVPSFYLRNGISFYVNGTAGYVLPDDVTRRDVINYILTAGISGPITPNISGSIGAGWSWSEVLGKTYVNPDPPFLPVTLPDESVDGPTMTLNLSYAEALRPNTTHSLSVFHNPGITALLEDSDVQETTGATYTISHRLNRYLVLTPSVGWVFTRTVIGPQPHEEVHLLNLGVVLQRNFGKHITTSLQYQFQTRDSNLDGNSYDENRITFTFLYIF